MSTPESRRPRPVVSVRFGAAADDRAADAPALRLSPLGRLSGGALLLVALAAATWAPSLSRSLLTLDETVVSENVALRNWPGLSRFWLEPARGAAWAPLPMTCLLLEHRAARDGALPYRAMSLLWHAATAVLLWRVLARAGAPGPLLAAAIFAVHPAQAEAAAWVAQRPTVMATALLLSSAWLMLRRLEGARWSGGAGLAAFAAACLCAPVAALAPSAGATLWRACGREAPRGLAAIAGVLGFVALGVHAWHDVLPRLASAGSTPDLLWRTVAGGYASLALLGDAAMPIGLSFADVDVADVTPARAIGGWIAWAVALAVLWRGGGRTGRIAAAMGVAWLLLTLPPLALQDRPFLHVAAWHRGMAYGAMGVFSAAAAAAGVWAVDAIGRRWGAVATRSGRLAMAAMVVAALAGAGMVRALEFRGLSGLWQAQLSRDPDHPAALRKLAEVELTQGRTAQAALLLRRVLDRRPNDPAALLLMAQARLRDEPDKAVALTWQVFRESPQHAAAQFAYAGALAAARQETEAGAEHQLLLDRFGDEPSVLNSLALLESASLRFDEAEALLRRAIAADRFVLGSYINLAVVLQRRGDPRGALATLDDAIRIDPRCFEAFVNAGAIAALAGEHDLAERALRNALAVRRDHPEAAKNLAKVLVLKSSAMADRDQQRRLRDEARFYLRLALLLAPADAEAAALLEEVGRMVDAGAPR